MNMTHVNSVVKTFYFDICNGEHFLLVLFSSFCLFD